MKRMFILFVYMILLCTACTSMETHEGENKLEKVKETDKFVYFCTDRDLRIADEIDKVLEERYPEICRDLEHDYAYKIIIEIFLDQESFDNNPSRLGGVGFPASSGDKKIQMVSPQSPIKVLGIPYEERLLMAVHEFTHLMVNEINNDAPMWLQEGVASYEGSKEGYEKIILDHIGKVPQFSFIELESSYYDLEYADVYSYFAVKFIVENYSYEKLSNILRQPGNLEEILQVEKDEFDKALNSYIQSCNQRAGKS